MEGVEGVEEGEGWRSCRRAAGVCVCAAWGVAVVVGGLLSVRPTTRRGYACDRDAEEGGRDGHREGGKANQGEPVQGAHQSAGDAKSEWRQAEGGEEEGKGCVCGSEQVSL